MVLPIATRACYLRLLLGVVSGGAAGGGVCAVQSLFVHRSAEADYFSLGTLVVPGEVRAAERVAGEGERGSGRAEQEQRGDPGNLMLRADVVVGCRCGGLAAPLRGAAGWGRGAEEGATPGRPGRVGWMQDQHHRTDSDPNPGPARTLAGDGDRALWDATVAALAAAGIDVLQAGSGRPGAVNLSSGDRC